MITCFGGEHAKNAGSAADVEDHFVFEEMFVVVHGISVGHRSHLKEKHGYRILWEITLEHCYSAPAI